MKSQGNSFSASKTMAEVIIVSNRSACFSTEQQLRKKKKNLSSLAKMNK